VSGPSKREEATAYHEAGHAVVGLSEDVPTRLVGVSIVPDHAAGTLGHVSRGTPPRVRDIEPARTGSRVASIASSTPTLMTRGLVERQLRPRIVELYAGVLAEKRFTGRRHDWVGASVDAYLWRAASSSTSHADRASYSPTRTISWPWPRTLSSGTGRRYTRSRRSCSSARR
jgi:hypothetical protein